VDAPAAFEIGAFVGLLVGEGHFGGDGRQPQVTLRMHTRHEPMFRWIEATFGGRVYGPYHHGGRDYMQWMARGDQLRSRVAPLLAGRIEKVDGHAAARFYAMCRLYAIDVTVPGSTDLGLPAEFDGGSAGVL
jgi:hypothetical protein